MEKFKLYLKLIVLTQMSLIRRIFKKTNTRLVGNIVLLFIIINFLSLLGLFIYIPRAIFYYEYALVLVVLIYFNKVNFAYLLFLFFLLLDFFDAFSSVYLFNAVELLKNFKYLLLYKISFLQVFFGLLAVVFLTIIYIIIKKINTRIQENKKGSIKLIALIYVFIFLFDLVNGSNILIDNQGSWKLSNKNIASFLAKNYIYFFQQITYSKSNRIDKYSEKSPVFSYLKNDTINNEIVIIVESWGLIKDSLIRNKVRQIINDKISENGFNYEWGKTRFNGSTNSAELKQFLNIKGEYQYYINHSSLGSGDTSIFNFKKTQGYHNAGFHSYTGKMFARESWWPNIGMQDVYFRDNYIMEHLNEPNSIQGDAPFPAIKDELMFDYLLTKTKGPQKEFTYFLTVNSHLPFRHKTALLYPALTNEMNGLEISEEAKNQLLLIYNQLAYFIEKLAKSKFKKIIIMGDHMPPFMNIKDRYFYSSKLVPYLYLSKD